MDTGNTCNSYIGSICSASRHTVQSKAQLSLREEGERKNATHCGGVSGSSDVFSFLFWQKYGVFFWNGYIIRVHNFFQDIIAKFKSLNKMLSIQSEFHNGYWLILFLIQILSINCPFSVICQCIQKSSISAISMWLTMKLLKYKQNRKK